MKRKDVLTLTYMTIAATIMVAGEYALEDPKNRHSRNMLGRALFTYLSYYVFFLKKSWGGWVPPMQGDDD